MTNDELNKLVERFINIEEALSKLLQMACVLAERDKQLIEIIKMQKEAIDFYASRKNWEIRKTYDHDVEGVIDYDDVDWIDGPPIGGVTARKTQSAVNEKLKELGIEI